ncbi:uncharacterized protein JCM6883_000680 [Sporobolomyces salmoneus]|uniref:uncharacterized protein n=1 Tax=Sporobolomyces salmoneus TaxID=183962 RepID=UPI0031760C51
MASTSKTLAVILGAGPGTGASIARSLARDGSSVALLARNAQSLKEVAESVKQIGGDAVPFSCDATSQESIESTFAEIRKQWPEHRLTRAFFNATNPFIRKPFLELEKKDLNPGLDSNVYGAFYFSQAVIPQFLSNGEGFLCFSGATASLKGSAQFAAFAPSKFALRGLAQSLAREFGGKGIHVAHAVIDGLIDTERVRGMAGEGEPGTRMDPDSIAESFLFLSKQPKDCWTHELDLRPSAEKW